MLLRLLAILLAVVVVATGCGNDPTDQAGFGGTTNTSESADNQSDTEQLGKDAASSTTQSITSEFLANSNELTIGVVLPESGTLSYLYPPLTTSVGLALQDIRAAGGKVRIIEGDSGTDPDVASETVNRLLGEGADVILGAAASGVSQSIIQTLFETEVAQCSGSNTSPNFSTQANAEFFFRTVTTAASDAPIMANNMARTGATNVAILARADDWGQSLATLLQNHLAELGATSQIISFSQDTSNFEDIVLSVKKIGADTVTVLAFAEGIGLLRRLLEAGIPPSAIHGGPGLYDADLATKANPSNPTALDGFTVYGASGGSNYNQRLTETLGGNIAFGGQYYDCVILLTLGALAAGTSRGPDLTAVVPELTRNGQKCFDFAQCAALLAQGADIDYDGASGPLELDDVGDTTVGRFAVAKIQDGMLNVVRVEDVTSGNTE
ncbi:MAG: amino acid ABC transporter substrate-binding protein [Acidimicrobiia bacterium]|nr:amino acid ABC transporter substrate-binding protein [Acidimicrobiia bacterium]